MADLDCGICGLDGVRRTHGGVMVCPHCDLNEPQPKPSPAVMPKKRPTVADDTESQQHG